MACQETEGGGEDTLAEVSCPLPPPPSPTTHTFYVHEILKNPVLCLKKSWYSLLT